MVPPRPLSLPASPAQLLKFGSSAGPALSFNPGSVEWTGKLLSVLLPLVLISLLLSRAPYERCTFPFLVFHLPLSASGLHNCLVLMRDSSGNWYKLRYLQFFLLRNSIGPICVVAICQGFSLSVRKCHPVARLLVTVWRCDTVTLPTFVTLFTKSIP